MSKKKPRYDGTVLITITAIIATSVVILGIVNTKTKFNFDTERSSILIEMENPQPQNTKLDSCSLGENNSLICDNK